MTKRLDFLASLLTKDNKVIDIGTDHAYLPILLHQKQIKCMGTDIHEKALISAYHNLEEYHLEKEIPLQLADGLNLEIKDYNTLVIAGMGFNTIKHILNNKDKLKNIDVSNYNTLVIAGMGYSTIKHILEDKTRLKKINKIIVQSNNDYDKLRSFLNQLNYTLKEEYILEDKNHIYHIMKYLKGKENLTKEEILMGKYNKDYKNYYKQDLNKLKQILKNIPNNHQEEKQLINDKIKILSKYCQE